MSELKPCPFCGGKAEERVGGKHVGAAFVRCTECGVEVCASYLGAVRKKWNTRSQDND